MSPAKAQAALERPVTAANPPGVQSVAILVVGENLKTRTLLTSVLGAFGVGSVLRAISGANALKLFHQMRRNPDRIGVAGLDLVMADWEMAQIDGAALLRWIRHHPDSPDPFLPFIAMGTAPSEGQVRAARDLGTNQFIARPFTIETLCAHLDSVTGDTRSYVKIRDFFGPDRRHHNVPVDSDLRGDPTVGRPGVRHLVAPMRLAAKLGGRFAPEAACLSEARDKLNAWQHEFVVTVENYLAQAEFDFAQIQSSRDAAVHHQGLADINRISRHLYGYGRRYGFPLVITLARSMYQLTDRVHQVDADFLELVRAHLDALQAALNSGLRSDAGKVGRKLAHELHRANQKIVGRAPDRWSSGPG